MLYFNFLEKDLEIFSPPHLSIIFQEKCFSYYNLLTDQISFFDCLYFLKHWAKVDLQVFAVCSLIIKTYVTIDNILVKSIIQLKQYKSD